MIERIPSVTVTSPDIRPVFGGPPAEGRARGIPPLIRERVLEVLDGYRDVPVVSVEAPGGYSKTTTLHQWARRDPRPVVWITVRPQAPDATWLANELLEGLHRIGATDQVVTLPTAMDPVTWHLALLPVVERVVARSDSPFLLVVDEAGALHGPQWDSLAASVAAFLPEGSQLVLSSRTSPPPSLRRLTASGELVSVGPDVLALDAVEGDQILRSLGLHLDQDTVLDLLERTGGWPIALPLVASALRSGRRGPGALVTTEALADYLRHEVLESLAPEDAQLLLGSSVLPDLTGPACDAVNGRSGSLARLRHLSAATHLLAASDAQASRFRLHPLFAAFLDEELHATDPEGWRAAHASAAAAAARLGDLDSAVFHLREAEDDQALGTMIWEHSGPLLGRGQSGTLRRWLDGLDDARLSQVPELALTAAWVASHEGDMVAMDRLRWAAHACAARTRPDFRLEIGLLDATVGADGLEALGSQAQAYLDGRDEGPWSSLAYLMGGISAGLLGDGRRAQERLERGHQMCVALDMPLMAAHCLAGLADLALQADDQERGIELAREAREIRDRDGLHHIATTAPIATTSAYAFLLEGRMAEARAEASVALRLLALIRPVAPWHAVQGRLALAWVFLGLGDAARARVLVTEASQISGPATHSPVLDEMLQRLREHTARPALRDLPGSTLTTAEVRVLQYLPTHMSFPEIAARLYVSRHTVKTQALSAYRKLGAHNRSEAIEEARRRGLLPPRS